MRGRTTIRLAGLLLALLLSQPAVVSALTACSAADVTAQDPGCPPGDGPCTITLDFTLAENQSCPLAFGARAVVLQGDIEGYVVHLSAGALTMAPGSSIRATYITLEVAGDLWLQRLDRYVRGLLRSGGGEIELDAEHIRIDGEVRADGDGLSPDGGSIDVTAPAGIVTGEASVMSVDARPPDGDYAYITGHVHLESNGPIEANGTLSSVGYGSDEGDVVLHSHGGPVTLNGRVRLDGWYNFSDAGSLAVYAETGITIGAKITAVAGPTIVGALEDPGFGATSGYVFAETTSGDIVISGDIAVDGSLYGLPGEIYASTWENGRLAMSGDLSVRAHRRHDSIGKIHLAGGEVEISGSIDAANGAVISLYGSRIDIGGSITGRIVYGAPPPGYGYDHGYDDPPTLEVFTDALLRISGEIDLSAIGCETTCDPAVDFCEDYGEDHPWQPICAEPWTLHLGGLHYLRDPSEIEIAAGGELSNTGRVGGDVALLADRLTVDGTIDTRGSSENGSVSLSAQSYCSITGIVHGPSSLHGACANPPTPGAPTPSPNEATPASTPTPTAPAPTPTATPVACPGDCDDDGAVDARDLLRIAAVIGACPETVTACAAFTPEEACLPADLDANGAISAGELTRIIAAMGICP